MDAPSQHENFNHPREIGFAFHGAGADIGEKDSFRSGTIYSNRIGIIKNSRRIGKINTVLIQICFALKNPVLWARILFSCLIVIPFQTHMIMICTICAQFSKKQNFFFFTAKFCYSDFICGQNSNLDLVRKVLSLYYTKYRKSQKYDAEFRAVEKHY